MDESLFLETILGGFNLDRGHKLSTKFASSKNPRPKTAHEHRVRHGLSFDGRFSW